MTLNLRLRLNGADSNSMFIPLGAEAPNDGPPPGSFMTCFWYVEPLPFTLPYFARLAHQPKR